MRSWRLPLAAVLVALALPTSAAADDVFGPLDEPSATASGPTIASDKADYAPSDIVTLTGSGWQPGESVHILVTDDGGTPEEPWVRDVVVVADDGGNIVDEFQLPPWIVAIYTVTATGESSGTATTTFTDAYVNRGCGVAGVGGPVPNPLPVTTTADEFDAINDGQCSLREAINAANELETGTVALQPDVNSISLPSGTYTLTVGPDGDDTTQQGDLDVRDDLTITKSNAGTAIIEGGASAATGLDRIFETHNNAFANTGIDLVLNEITVRHGKDETGGGGIRMNDGSSTKPVTLTLNDSLVTDNKITGGNGGGGIFGGNQWVTITLNNSDVTNNFGDCSGCDGGGILSGGGVVNINDSHVDNNMSRNNGGGIWNNQNGDVTLDNSTVDGNASINPPLTPNNDGTGGGIHMLAPSSTLVLTNGSSVSNNSAPEDGGGMFVQNGDVTIEDDSVVNGNDAGRDGGGIQANSPDELSVVDSEISNNDAGRDGGGFYGTIGNNNQALIMKRSLVSGNDAGDDGGGLWLLMVSTIANTTITNNNAGTDGAITGTGGGLIARDRAVGLFNVTLSHNVADGPGDGIISGRNGTGDVAAISLSNTIVANNDGAGTNCASTGNPVNFAAEIVNVTNNLDSGSTCGWGTNNGSQSNADPMLDDLQDNGGPTFTRGLLTGSDAIDTANGTVCTNAPVEAKDQRSMTRPDGAGCDIGAFEGEITSGQTSASITVSKVYSPAGPTDPVDVGLSCVSGSIDDDSQQATPGGPDAVFTVTGFTPGDDCTVTETTVPTGYTVSYGGDDCDSGGAVDMQDGNTMNCTITNTQTSASITVDKVYAPATSTTPVTVNLDCESGDIDDDSQTADPDGDPDAVFTITGFNVGDTCTVSEVTPNGWTATFSGDCDGSGDVTMAVDDFECTITNVPETTIVTAGGCTFDRMSDRAGNQFPLILTPETGSFYKLSSTNPGQFFLNVAYDGEEGDDIVIDIPYPFVFQGTNPIKVHSDVAVTNVGGKTCFEPGGTLLSSESDQVQWTWSTDGFGQTKQVHVTAPEDGLVYVRIHMAYGLKGLAGTCTKGSGTPASASCTKPKTLTIPGFLEYQFSFTGTDNHDSGGGKVEHFTEFKKNPGIGGLVLQTNTFTPFVNAKAEIYQGTKKVGTVYTDQDGWYLWIYKYTGKATTFTVKLPSNGNATQSATLKSNGYLSINFNLP